MYQEEIKHCINLVRDGDARGLSYRVVVSGTRSSPMVTLWRGSGVVATYKATPEQADQLVAAHAADQRR